MEFYLLFLIGCFMLGLSRPTAPLRSMMLIVFALGLMLSIGVFVFRLR